MNRVLVYSHDTYGLGNIRRMLAICERLLAKCPDLSILLVTGSPMIQSFRLPARLDYIKLPCVSRTASDVYEAKSLGTAPDETMQLRRDLLVSAAENFKPDLILVDKKPCGVKNELKPVLEAATARQPKTPIFLILRDILDEPEVTIASWTENAYYDAISRHYDGILVLGVRHLFDVEREYAFPKEWESRVHFCGYTRRAAPIRSASNVRHSLDVHADEDLVLVTPGGGEDGAALIETYIASLSLNPRARRHSLLITGPEMDPQRQRSIAQAIERIPNVRLLEFTDDLTSYMAAADLVVAMGGYNTVCEILSAERRAVLIPRVRPVKEQLIRAERLSEAGYLRFLHPDDVTPSSLAAAIDAELHGSVRTVSPFPLDLDGLDRVAETVMRTLAAKPPAALCDTLRHPSLSSPCLAASAGLA